MNKFCPHTQGSIRDDLKYIQSLDKRSLEREVWNNFCFKSNAADDDEDNQKQRKFNSHPKRLCSDSSICDSARGLNVYSSDSDLNHNLEEDRSIYEENKLKIKDARKKLHQNSTEVQLNGTCRMDLDRGDSCSISPRSNIQHIEATYFDSERYVKTASNRTKNKHKSAMTIPSKKIVPLKSPSLQNPHRNVITDSVFEKKFKMFVEKSLHTISDIRSLLDGGVTPPDGDEDTSRRMIRVKEFSNRFSRNYLYPLVRQIGDLNEIDPDNINLNQKLLSAYQIILSGLQAYHNHLPTSIGSCSSDKLKMLLKHLLELCDIHGRVARSPDENGHHDFINTYKLNAELTLQKIDDHFSSVSTDSILKSNTTKLSLQRYGAPKTNSKKGGKPKKSKVEARLSMYNVSASFRRDPQWKKSVDVLAKKKFAVKSRYKTATYRHRPPVEKEPQILSLPSKCKLITKKSSGILKRTPVTTPVNEDNITTLIQMEDKQNSPSSAKENNEKSTEQLNHEGIVVKLLQLVLDNNQRRTAEGDQAGKNDAKASNDKEIADILERLRNEGNVDVLQKILDGLQSKNAEQELKLQIVKSSSSIDEGAMKKRKEPIITVTGEKNAKLICIKDENSIIEDDSSKSDAKDKTDKEIPLKAVSSSETQTDLKPVETVTKSTQKKNKTNSIKINRLPKSSKCLQMLPKNYAVNIIQYKLDFHKHCKMNPIYRRTTNMQPWMLMGKISDEILNSALLGVAREIEVNDVVRQIYDSELQL